MNRFRLLEAAPRVEFINILAFLKKLFALS